MAYSILAKAGNLLDTWRKLAKIGSSCILLKLVLLGVAKFGSSMSCKNWLFQESKLELLLQKLVVPRVKIGVVVPKPAKLELHRT